jgi:hypothetical protein
MNGNRIVSLTRWAVDAPTRRSSLGGFVVRIAGGLAQRIAPIAARKR